MKDFESLTVISVEFYYTVNPDWFKCFKMITSPKHSLEIKNSNPLRYLNKVS